jgi:hypothetical protein
MTGCAELPNTPTSLRLDRAAVDLGAKLGIRTVHTMATRWPGPGGNASDSHLPEPATTSAEARSNIDRHLYNESGLP